MNKHQEADEMIFKSANWMTNEATFRDRVTQRLSTFSADFASEAIKKYKPNGFNPWERYTQMVSDIRSVCPLTKLAREIAAGFDSKVFMYVSTQARNSSGGSVADGLSDIEAILGVYNPEDHEQRVYVDNIQKMFYYFVYNGDTRRNQAVPRYIDIIDDTVTSVPYDYPQCEFWLSSPVYPLHARME